MTWGANRGLTLGPSDLSTAVVLGTVVLSRSVAVAITAVVLALSTMGADSCGSSDSGGGRSGNASSDGPFTSAKIAGKCPAALQAHTPFRFKAVVDNTGTDDWPTTYFDFSDLSHFALISITDDTGHKGKNLNVPTDFATYAFGPLKAGSSKMITALMSPNAAGNQDIQISAWGDQPGGDGIPPDSAKLVGCKGIPIVP